MKKNLLSWLMLMMVLVLAVSACTKKEEPAETALPAMEDMAASTEDAASAAKTDFDEDIFDLDPIVDGAGDMVSDATEQVQDTATGLVDQVGNTVPVDTTVAVVATEVPAVEAAIKAEVAATTAVDAAKKAEAAAASAVDAAVVATTDTSKPA